MDAFQVPPAEPTQFQPELLEWRICRSEIKALAEGVSKAGGARERALLLQERKTAEASAGKDLLRVAAWAVANFLQVRSPRQAKATQPVRPVSMKKM